MRIEPGQITTYVCDPAFENEPGTHGVKKKRGRSPWLLRYCGLNHFVDFVEVMADPDVSDFIWGRICDFNQGDVFLFVGWAKEDDVVGVDDNVTCGCAEWDEGHW